MHAVLILALTVLLVALPLVALPAVGLAYLVRPKPLNPSDERVVRASSGTPVQYDAVLRALAAAGLEEKVRPEESLRCVADHRSRWSFWDTTSWCLKEGRTVLATPTQGRPFTQQDAAALYAKIRAQDSRCFHDEQPADPRAKLISGYQITCATAGIRYVTIDIHGVEGGSAAGDPWDRPGLGGLPHSPGQLPVVISFSVRFIDQEDVE
jgi:hypothetical protein